MTIEKRKRGYVREFKYIYKQNSSISLFWLVRTILPENFPRNFFSKNFFRLFNYFKKFFVRECDRYRSMSIHWIRLLPMPMNRHLVSDQWINNEGKQVLVLIMLDFMTRRRLIFSLIAFLFITLSIIFFAQLRLTNIQQFTPFYSLKSSSSSSSSSSNNTIELTTSTCHQTEPVEILETCRKCTPFDRRSQSSICSSSGYKELVLCSTSKTQTFRSCPIPANIQKHQFWMFEFVIFALALISMASVHYRQKLLDKQMVEKIKRQIGESAE